MDSTFGQDERVSVGGRGGGVNHLADLALDAGAKDVESAVDIGLVGGHGVDNRLGDGRNGRDMEDGIGAGNNGLDGRVVADIDAVQLNL